MNIPPLRNGRYYETIFPLSFTHNTATVKYSEEFILKVVQCRTVLKFIEGCTVQWGKFYCRLYSAVG